MRRLCDIEDLVFVGDRWWGTLFWMKGSSGAVDAPHGFDVRHFRDPALLKAYADMLEEGFGWGHADPLAWHVLIIDCAEEVGEDFAMIRRRPGTTIRNFYPEHTDDPVEPPVQQLSLLHETVARMRLEAEGPRDRFLAELLAKRLAGLDSHLVFDWGSDENRFHLWDLDPDRVELDGWIAMPATQPTP